MTTCIMFMSQVGQQLVEEGHPQADEFKEMIEDLRVRWEELLKAVDERKKRLELSETAQQVSAEIN